MTNRSPTPDQDEFWYQQAADILRSTSAQLISGAERIAGAMAWFWTVYSAAALVVTFGFDVQPRDWQIALIAAPAVLLFLAYLLATWATLPIDVAFNDQRADQIKRAVDEAVTERRMRLRWCVRVAVVAALAVTATVVAAAAVDKADADVVHFDQSTSEQLLVAGLLTDVDVVIIELSGSDGTFDEQLVPVVDGRFSTSITVESDSKYVASARYERNEQTIVVSEVIESSGQ